MVSGELRLNHSLLTHELSLEQRIFGSDNALNGAVNRHFNAMNLEIFGIHEQAINAVVGAQDPSNLTPSLLTGNGQGVFNDGQIGGILGAFDQSLAASADLAGLIVGALGAH